VLLTDVDPAPSPPMQYGDRELLAARLNRLPEPGRGDLVASGARYRAALAAAGTSDHAVATSDDPPRRSWGWLRDVALVVLLAPFALIGLLAAAIPLLLVVLASKLHVAPAVRATVVPGLALLLFLGEWLLFARPSNNGGLTIELAALVLFPFFVASLFLVSERVTLLWQRWRGRRRPGAAELERLEELRGEVAAKGWAAL
jgi:hypothetical protein